MPTRYEDRRVITPAGQLVSGKAAVVRGVLARVNRRRARGRGALWITTAEACDATGSIALIWFGAWKSDAAVREGEEILLWGTPEEKGRSLEISNPAYKILTGAPGEALLPDAEWNRIVPIYPTTGNLPRKWITRIVYECAGSPSLQADETLPQDILAKRTLLPLRAALRGIHRPSSRREIVESRNSLAYREFFALQRTLWEIRAERAASGAPSLAAGVRTQERFLRSLRFTLTPAQREALREISADLDREIPMTRLLQGDVGSGKTVVALAAAAKALGAGRQVAILAPTTVLSAQLWAECERYLTPLGFPCMEMTGGLSAPDRKKLLARVGGSEPLVLSGTHALLGEEVIFGNLGLAIIDEQHRFGVAQRSLLRGKNDHAHVLMMSATPIPRTLCLALYGDTDSSVIRERPRGRRPVATKIVDARLIDSVYRYVQREIESGGRCYWICPLIGDEEEGVLARAKDMTRALPGVKIAALHGGMTAKEKKDVMARFAAGERQAVVSTTVVEVGLDVLDASVIVIESAASFGLSQLHQLRGRVGRGARRGVCLLLEDAQKAGTNERLTILERCDDGFAIAEADLKLRGAGELTGLKQHGEAAFRVADLAKDAKLLEWAREDAIRFCEGKRL